MPFKHPFYFLRHGETHWNRDRLTQGQLDTLLNDNGLAQAARAAEILSDQKFARIVASPLSRARVTAEKVAERKGLTVETDPELMECHLGDYQGRPHGPWLAEYWRDEHDPPGGEAYRDFCARVWGAMVRAAAETPDTLIVAHGGLWLAAHEFVRIEPQLSRMPNALPIHVTPEPGLWRIRVLDPDRVSGGVHSTDLAS